MPQLLRIRRTRPLLLDVLEARVVLDVTPPVTPPVEPPPGGGKVPTPPAPGQPPLAVHDDLGFDFTQPSNTENVLANDLDGNPGATWDFSSLTVVSPPAYGALTLDPASGVFLYT